MIEQKVTVITPTYNSEKQIERCLQSVAMQTYSNKEHLIIDGVSSDETVAMISRYMNKYPHIRLLSEPDQGVYDAMNKGIGMSRGEWLHFLGSDDWLNDKSVLIDVMVSPAISEADIVYGNVQTRGKIYDGEFTCEKLTQRNVCHQAMFFRRSIFDRMGRYDLSYRVLADWVFNIRCFGDKEIIKVHVDRIIAQYSAGGFSAVTEDYDFLRDKDEIIARCFPPNVVEKYKHGNVQDFVITEEEVVRLRLEISRLEREMSAIYKTAAGKFIKKYKKFRKKR